MQNDPKLCKTTQMILFFKGLPSSSKTTTAKQLCIDYPKYVRISKDDIRAERFPNWKQKDEREVVRIETEMAVNAINAGKSPIIDSTNFNTAHHLRYKQIAEQFNIPLVVDDSFLSVTLEECIERDSKREKPVGESVIREMWLKYLAPKYEHKDNLPWCIIFDVDNTLALKGDRGIFDDTKLHLDTLNKPVGEIYKAFQYGNNDMDYTRIILSGRQDSCKEQTSKWLSDNEIYYDEFYMRKTGDTRSDEIVKWELFNEHIMGKYNVLFVLDDRMKVCRMWHEKGLFVLNCNQGLIEF